MKFKDLTSVEKIDYAARYLIVHSIIYYELNESVIPDKKWDKRAALLVKLLDKYPKTARKSEYYDVIWDFDGSTGFDLYYRLTKSQRRYHKQIALHVLWLYRGGY